MYYIYLITDRSLAEQHRTAADERSKHALHATTSWRTQERCASIFQYTEILKKCTKHTSTYAPLRLFVTPIASHALNSILLSISTTLEKKRQTTKKVQAKYCFNPIHQQTGTCTNHRASHYQPFQTHQLRFKRTTNHDKGLLFVLQLHL